MKINIKKTFAFAAALSLCALTVPFSDAVPSFSNNIITASAASDLASVHGNYDSATKTLVISGSGSANGKILGNVKDAETIVFNTGITQITSFNGLSNLKRVEIKSASFVFLGEAFASCPKLTDVVIENAKIGVSLSGTFKNCTALKNVDFGTSTLTKQSYNCGDFAGCTALKKIVLPKGMEYIEERTFSGCTALEEVIIPDGVTKVYAYAFEKCSNLKKVYIPASLNPEGNVYVSGINNIIDSTKKNLRFYIDSKAINTINYAKKNNIAYSITGDANCDGAVDMSDVTLIMQSVGNPSRFGVRGTDKSHITSQGVLNADVYEPGYGITNMDATTIQKYMNKTITSLPVVK